MDEVCDAKKRVTECGRKRESGERERERQREAERDGVRLRRRESKAKVRKMERQGEPDMWIDIEAEGGVHREREKK